jgi:hypothetical protein
MKQFFFRPKGYEPNQLSQFRLSRSKVDLFLECKRCFYLDRRYGIVRPPMPSFTLNLAVDALLKKEFDQYRVKGKPHPVMDAAGIDAVPFAHPKLEEWRDSLRAGITYLFPNTNLVITGGIDDIWLNKDGELAVVDYKATAKVGDPVLEGEFAEKYKRQLEIYQWLFRKNDFSVSDTGYFVYCNADLAAKDFKERLSFDTKIIPYKGDDGWIEPTIHQIFSCLNQSSIPDSAENCRFCWYRGLASQTENMAPKA